MKAERVCYPQIRIDDRMDSSTQPTGSIAYKPSKRLECGLWLSGRTGHREAETHRDGLQAASSVHGPSLDPTLPAEERRFIRRNVGTRRF